MTSQSKDAEAADAPDAGFMQYAGSPLDVFAMRLVLYAHDEVPPKYWPEIYLVAEKAYQRYVAQREVSTISPNQCMSLPLADLHFWKFTHECRLRLRQINKSAESN